LRLKSQNSSILGLLTEFAELKMLKNGVFSHFFHQKGQSPTNSWESVALADFFTYSLTAAPLAANIGNSFYAIAVSLHSLDRGG